MGGLGGPLVWGVSKQTSQPGLSWGARLVIITLPWICSPVGKHYLAHGRREEAFRFSQFIVVAVSRLRRFQSLILIATHLCSFSPTYCEVKEKSTSIFCSQFYLDVILGHSRHPWRNRYKCSHYSPFFTCSLNTISHRHYSNKKVPIRTHFCHLSNRLSRNCIYSSALLSLHMCPGLQVLAPLLCYFFPAGWQYQKQTQIYFEQTRVMEVGQSKQKF